MNVIYFGWRSQGLRKHLLSRRPVRFIQHGSFEAQSSMHSMLLNMPKLYLFYHKYIHEQFVKFEYYICPDGRERGEVFMRTEDSGWWFKVIWGRDWQPFCPRTKGSRRRKTDGSQLHASETKIVITWYQAGKFELIVHRYSPLSSCRRSWKQMILKIAEEF